MVAYSDKMEFHDIMTYIRYWEDIIQKKDFIVFYDKSSFLSRNIQKFETISTIDGFAFAFIFYVAKHNFGMRQTLSIVYSHLKFLCLLETVYMRNTEPDILIHF